MTDLLAASLPAFAGSPTGYFLSFEGIDGSGKTTLARATASVLASSDVSFCSSKSIPLQTEPVVRSCMEQVSSLLWPKRDTDFDHLLPAEYWLHLQGAWYSLISQFQILPRLREGETLLTDGWFYKFFAKLRLRGFELDHLEATFRDVVQPGLVILLDVDVEGVWNRKKTFRLTEMGLHHNDDYPSLGRESFVHYQSQVLSKLKEIAAAQGWAQVRLDPTTSIEHNSRLLAEQIREFRPKVQLGP